jgi:hypothetical protein
MGGDHDGVRLPSLELENERGKETRIPKFHLRAWLEMPSTPPSGPLFKVSAKRQQSKQMTEPFKYGPLGAFHIPTIAISLSLVSLRK